MRGSARERAGDCGREREREGERGRERERERLKMTRRTDQDSKNEKDKREIVDERWRI